MNWELAKNWLITAFLLLDLFLGWQVYTSRQEMAGSVESYSDQVANTKTLLAQHGFSLGVQIPTNHPDMSLVRADFRTPDLNAVSKVAFPHAKTLTLDPKTGLIESDDGTIKVFDKGHWQVNYTDNPVVSVTKPDTVQALLWQGTDYVFDDHQSIIQAKNSRKSDQLVFELEYNSYPLFDAPVNVVVKDQRVQRYDQIYLGDVAAEGDKKPTITALDALNNIANAVDKSMVRPDNRIIDIRLGYYHKVSNTPAGQSASTSTAYWFPVWRVVTEEQVLYVNAFTGEVDMPS